MAGQSGHNLHISKSKLGAPRFPFERPGVGNGYAGAGPVVEYKITEEERLALIAKLGPVNEKRKRQVEYMRNRQDAIYGRTKEFNAEEENEVAFETYRAPDPKVETPSAPAVAKTVNEDGIDWAVPFGVERIPILRMHEKGISLNSAAMRDMKEIRYLRIGVRDGTIYLLPSTESFGCYKIRYPERSSKTVSVGGNALVKHLAKHGIRPGKYPLVHNTEKQRWEAVTI